MRKTKLFAASGSTHAQTKIIIGQVSGITFKSNFFNGVMDSQKFWDNLSLYAKKTNKYIELCYYE